MGHAKVVFKLRNCDEQEADQVRQALDEANIPCYETQGGLLGIGFPAIWVHDDSDYARARAVIDRVQAELEPPVRQTVAEMFRADPLKYCLMLLAIVVILVISLRPIL